jgi:hypothetical protein
VALKERQVLHRPAHKETFPYSQPSLDLNERPLRMAPLGPPACPACGELDPGIGRPVGAYTADDAAGRNCHTGRASPVCRESRWCSKPCIPALIHLGQESVRRIKMLDWLYESDLSVLYPLTAILIVGAAEVGGWIARRSFTTATGESDISTLTGAALGLLALLLAFSFSLALSRYEARRNWVLEEANAIGSTANFALMLPEPAREPVLHLLGDYTTVRIGLGIPFDPTKLERDIARSLDLQTKLWQLAVALTAAEPQSLPVYRFVASLNEMNNIHERRLTALRYHVPGEVMFMLIGVAMVAMGFTGYNASATGSRRRVATAIMSLMVATVMMLVIDLDRSERGLTRVPVQPLVDAAQSIPP